MNSASNDTAKSVNESAKTTPEIGINAEDMEASFTQSYHSIEAYLKAIVARFGASQSLLNAEAKLSLSALFMIFLGSMVFIGVAATTWLLINVFVGLILYQFMSSIVVVLILLTVNGAIALMLYKYLGKLKAMIGFSKTLTSITNATH